jgi:hypothetical protein
MMEFYKKNPAIKGTIWVQGKEVGDNDVVCGEEFRLFADPSTFPGIPVRLIKTEFGSLNQEQVKQVQNLSKEIAERPPRHLPPIMSDQISMTSGGEVKIIEPIIEKKNDNAVEKTQVKLVVSKADKPLTEVFSFDEFVGTFSGITEGNAENILNKFKTMRDFAKATNVELRTAGVKSNFFSRLRTAVITLLEEWENEE